MKIPHIWKLVRPIEARLARSEDFWLHSLSLDIATTRAALQISQTTAGRVIGASQSQIGYLENHPHEVLYEAPLRERAKELARYYKGELAKRIEENGYFRYEFKVIRAIIELIKYSELGPDDIHRIGAELHVYEAARGLVYLENYLAQDDDWYGFRHKNNFWNYNVSICCDDIFRQPEDPRKWTGELVYTIDECNDILAQLVKNNTVVIPRTLDELSKLINEQVSRANDIRFGKR